MEQRVLRILSAVLAAALVPACGGGGGGGPSGPVTIFDCSGGSGFGSGTAFGGVASFVEISTSGSLSAGVHPAPQAPAMPVPPASGTVIASLTGTQTVLSGNALIPGVVTASLGFTVELICSEGDIVVSGTLNAGEVTGIPINLALTAPNGTVYVTGAIHTTNPVGLGAGSLTITARRIVVTGLIDTSGRDHGVVAGGDGGAVSLLAQSAGQTDILMVGSIVTSGGSSTAANGGAAGGVEMRAREELHVRGSVTSRGGSASAATNLPLGGNGGLLRMTGGVGVFVDMTLDQSGGAAKGTATGAWGGREGGLIIDTPGIAEVYGTFRRRKGDATAPAGTAGNPITGGGVASTGGTIQGTSGVRLGALSFLGRGGDSSDQGGGGGRVTLDGQGLGDMTVSGTIDVRGGRGANSVGASFGGSALTSLEGDITFNGEVRTGGSDGAVAPAPGGDFRVTTGGSVFLSGLFDLGGGSSTASAATAVAGAPGGKLEVSALLAGSFIETRGLTVLSNGGASTGAAAGGAGGMLEFWTVSLRIVLDGTFTARGGSAPGGTGGQGGRVMANSDMDADGTGGDITLAAGASIDVSGGSGQTGGSARTGVGTEAVAFDADGNNSNSGVTGGIVQNLGSITARGGDPAGSGGRVFFDGLTPAFLVGPFPGTQDRSPGAAGGIAGLFTGN